MKCNFCEEKAVWEVRAQTVNIEEEEGGGFKLTLTVCGGHKAVAADEIAEIIEALALGGISSAPDPVSVKAFPLIQ